MVIKIVLIGILCILITAIARVFVKKLNLSRSKPQKVTAGNNILPLALPEVSEFSADSRFDTELDLAKAYLELHQPEKAKSLLKSVITQGDVMQIAEARKMFSLLLKQERESK